MKIGLLGDIHGNAAALEAVLAAATSEAVETLLITGDLVGYYFEPAEVLKQLRGWNKYIVRGNHEDMLTAALADDACLPQIEKSYGSGLRVALETLDRGQLLELSRLPHPLSLEFDGMRILLAHGAPFDNDCYVYPDAEPALLQRCATADHDMVVMGHTHYPLDSTVGATRLINPGSVGQPRNRHPGAQWALLDTKTRLVSFRNEAYNHLPLLHEARQRHPELPYLAEVLTRT